MTHCPKSQTSANQRHSTGSELGTPVVQRNRRLAAMQKLHDAGEYFSTEAMQERDPAMYDQYIGQYLRNQGGLHRMHVTLFLDNNTLVLLQMGKRTMQLR